MRDSWVTLGGAIAALLIVALLFYQPVGQQGAPRPTTLEAGPNGYRAMHDWLSGSGIEVHSIQQRLKDFFEASSLPETGNILVSVMPHAKSQRHSDHRALRSWVRAGNTLVLMVALNDTPAWQFSGFDYEQGDVSHLIQVDFQAEESEADEPLPDDWWDPQTRSFVPYPEHPLMAGINELRVISDGYASEWRADFSGAQEHPLKLARDASTGMASLWEMSFGDGRVVLSSTAGLLSNRMLGEADNARFLSNLVAWNLAPEGAVLFDDYHQGVSELYDPEAFFRDSRLHISLLFLVALWLFYLLGSSARLGPLRQSPPQTGQAALVSATAVLMSRKLSEAESGRAMINAWLNQLRATGRLPYARSEEPPWAQLAEMPLADPGVVKEIQEQYVRMGTGQKVDLVRLHNNIQTLKGYMA